MSFRIMFLEVSLILQLILIFFSFFLFPKRAKHHHLFFFNFWFVQFFSEKLLSHRQLGYKDRAIAIAGAGAGAGTRTVALGLINEPQKSPAYFLTMKKHRMAHSKVLHACYSLSVFAQRKNSKVANEDR